MSLLVSVVIPVYKTEEFIEKSLKSICEQTLDMFEIIIIDDCSPDNAIKKAEEVLQSYPQRLQYTKIIRLPKNGGLASARKIAFKEVQGKYVTCLDSDDYLEVKALEEMLKIAQSQDADIVVCDYFLTYKNSEKKIKQFIQYNNFLRCLLESKLHGSYCNKLYKKELLDKIKILDNINMFEDYLAMVQMAVFAKKVVYLDRAFLHYVQYNEYSYTANYSEKNIQDILAVMNYLESFLKVNHLLVDNQDYFNHRKVFVKYVILSNSHRGLRKKYLSLYTDIEIKNIPLHFKIILFLSRIKANFIIDLFIIFKKNMKKMLGNF